MRTKSIRPKKYLRDHRPPNRDNSKKRVALGGVPGAPRFLRLERDVLVLAAAVRGGGERRDENGGGVGRGDDLVDDADLDRAFEAADGGLVLGGELGLRLVQLVGRDGGELPLVQDADGRARAPDGEL